MARRTKEEAAETRELLLKAALDVFCEKGFSKSRLVDIPARIGMTRGALYWHFKDKLDLLVGLLEKLKDREERLVRERVPELETLSDLRDHFVAHGRVVMEDEFCRKFLFFLIQQMEWSVEMLQEVRSRTDTLRERPFNEVFEALKRNQEAGLIRKEVNTDQAADILISLWMGLVSNSMKGFIHSDLDRLVYEGFTMVLNSIAAAESEPLT